MCERRRHGTGYGIGIEQEEGEGGEENKRKAAAGWQLLFALEIGGRRLSRRSR